MMSKSVQIANYGGIDRLRLVEVQKPQPQSGDVIVKVVAAGTNPGEIAIREGLLKDMFPMDLPFGQGTDFAGIVDAVGPDVHEFSSGDCVIGWSEQRSAQAEYVRSDAEHLIMKPHALDWFRAGGLFVVATTAVAAVRAVSLKPGDVVAVSGAAGGVGSLAIQLARRSGARVLGIASEQSADFLHSVGVEPIAYGDDLAARLRTAAPTGIDAFIDLFGNTYIDLAVSLGVDPQRINTIIDFANAQKYGTKAAGSSEAGTRDVLTSVADAIAWGELLMPLTAVYPFGMVHDAYTQLALRKTRGKIVLAFDPSITQPSKRN